MCEYEYMNYKKNSTAAEATTAKIIIIIIIWTKYENFKWNIKIWVCREHQRTSNGYVMLLCVLHTRTSTFFVNEKTQERHAEQKRDRRRKKMK